MRVHELAKELNLKSQEIIEVLSGTEHAVSSHSSSIDETAQQIVRNKFKNKGKISGNKRSGAADLYKFQNN